ncbi:hypothetical protein BBK36DRAFT_1121654 [Trichoderma citrinoviride]|uniref:F-box domain-containing protein n=1 Tax=Trichoderma citrinoviride TaxID=58853 RepID=A0A2T4B874_9HYPO|nr:hypothetical protein BBK36DRAFT_1121654 [Trichoderma citrinoviride]PTB65488.1 hypothetical protein BBK36DRAFT_1121654 [Trichoderma citrinoviride]
MHQHDGHPIFRRRSQRFINANASRRKGFKGLSSPPRLTIFTLPTEILLMLISFLEGPWRLSLAMTCKFFAKLTPEEFRSCLGLEDRIKFLSTLQKDVPNTYFCYCCTRLRPLNPSLDWRAQAHADSTRSFENSLWLPVVIRSGHIKLPKRYNVFLDKGQISFMEVYLFMRRHLYGFPHGISPQSLERYEAFEDVVKLDECLWSRISSPEQFKLVPKKKTRTFVQLPGRGLEAVSRAENAWRFSFRYTPRIVNDKLYLARFYAVVGPHVPLEHLNRLISSIGIPICNHLYCSAEPSCCSRHDGLRMNYLRYYPRIQTTLPCLYHHDGKDLEFDSKQDSCLICSTDYDVSLRRRMSNNETSLSISMYHCLGSCQSPNDKLWAYFATSGREPWNHGTFLPSTKDEVSEAPLSLSFGGNAAARFRYDVSHRFQKLKARIPELDLGGSRRIWHVVPCSE